MKKMECDIAVIAAGLSGLAATCAAAEQGLNVITVEKSNVAGGAANMGMQPLGVGTRQQREIAWDITPGEIFRYHADFVHWNVDQRLLRNYYFRSADTLEWLESMGVRFAHPEISYPVPERMRRYASPFPTAHSVLRDDGSAPSPRCAATMTKKMQEYAIEQGANILFNTSVTKILKENGRVCGVMAKDEQGEEIQIDAKAVIVCTGGAGDNPDMIKEHMGYEWGRDLFSFRIPGMKGEGMRMAWEVGAAKTPLRMELMYQCPDNNSVWELDGGFRQPDLWVNKRGERFCDESGAINSTFMGNAIAQQPGHFALAVLDTAQIRKYKKRGPAVVDHVHGAGMFDNMEELFQQYLDNGYEYAYKADTLEELAEKAGIDVEGFVNQVEEYNDMCDSNYDELFEKEARYMNPVRKAPFYAVKFFIGAYGTLGGIKINYKTEVVDEQDEAIPGLYAAGTDACNIFGDCYPFTLAGNTMGFSLNTGRMAGENAAEYIETI